MEELQARHRKEQRDLQSQITQKKKQATKKTRKSVNDECERLEAELKQRQKADLDALQGNPPDHDGHDELSKEELEALTLTPTVESNENDHHEPNPTPPLAPSDLQHSSSQAPAQRKPNRQKARLARRAAEQASQAEIAATEALNLPDLKAAEHSRMQASIQSHQLTEKLIRADGHCLYSAVADQLTTLRIPLTPAADTTTVQPYKTIRHVAADWIDSHREDFEPFVEDERGFEEYVRKVRDTGEWGGQLELTALARAYGVAINVLQDYGRVEKIEGNEDDGTNGEERKEMWLGYYKHGFGLGEHYNSLRKLEGRPEAA